MIELRPFQPSDLEALYHICLVTGDAGQDASALHNDPKLIGHLYSAPYGALEPERALVAEDANGNVAGYLVGTHDTVAFTQRLEEQWWPELRARYSDLSGLTEADRDRVAAIVRPHTTPAELVSAYPAHIHMNLLPHMRGQGVGKALLRRWIDEARLSGVSGIHLGASASNAGGVGFWRSSGFIEQQVVGSTIWFGMTL